MTSKQDFIVSIVEVLIEAGFVEDGKTNTETVRIPTMKSPVFSRSGGELRTFGGRARYTKVGSDVRVTVGPRTVNVYKVMGWRMPMMLAGFDTKGIDLDKLRTMLKENT